MKGLGIAGAVCFEPSTKNTVSPRMTAPQNSGIIRRSAPRSFRTRTTFPRHRLLAGSSAALQRTDPSSDCHVIVLPFNGWSLASTGTPRGPPRFPVRWAFVWAVIEQKKPRR